MINASNAFITKVNSDSRTFKARFLVGGSELSCDVQSITLYKGAGSEIVPGSLYVPYFEANVANYNALLVQSDIVLQIGLVVNGADEYITLGTFTVVTEKNTHGSTFLAAVGQLNSKASELISIAAGTTIASAISQIQTATGCTVTLKGLVASGSIANALNTTCREALCEIASLLGGFVTEDNAGGIVIAKYGSGTTLAVNGDRMLQAPEANSGDYAVTGLKVIVSPEGVDEDGEDIPEVAFTSGTPNIIYETANMTAALFSNVVSNVVGYSFRPAFVPLALGDPRLEPWDTLNVTDPEGSIYTVPCLQMIFRFDGGLQTDIDAQIKTDEENETTIAGPISRALEQYAADLVTAKDAILGRAKISDLEAETARVNNLLTGYAHITNGVIDNAKINDADVNGLSANFAHMTNGVIDNAKIEHADVNGLNANYVHMTNGVIDNAKIGHVDVNGLSANYAHVTNGVIDNASIDYANVNNLDAHYASIDLANVNNAWIENGSIKDAAISDAQILDVSANKLTTGTIDAGVINVINLNASNLTVGTINGQRIGNGSIDLGKLSERVPTKEYLDSVEKNLQDQIDGVINTWTGDDIPTLSNYPASNWPDAKTRDAHIGDIYYVVNGESEYDGWCYRFVGVSYDASIFVTPDEKQLAFPDDKILSIYAGELAYKWVLIKDSDVTKALAELVTVEGDISGLKSFQTSTAAWIVNTDDELASVKGRTTSLETNMGSKVDITTFNTLSQTVDENSANITTLQSTVANKADGSTVTALSNTVNSISQKADANEAAISTLTSTVESKADGSTVSALSQTVNTVQQTANGNSATISSLTSTLGTNADGTTKAGDIVQRTSAVEQDLSGFKTTVSETYATKTSLPTKTSDLTNDSGYATQTEAQGYAAAAETNAKADTTNKLLSYSTTTEMNTAISQSAAAIEAEITASERASKTYADGLIEDEVTARNTAISASASDITASVSATYETKTDATGKLNAAKDYTDTEITTAKAAIKITTDAISTEVSNKVGNDEVISRINQSAEAIKIEADKVNIVGVINAINNDTTTTIDGGKIKTGSISIGNLDSGLQEVINASDDQLRLEAEYEWGTSSITLNAKVYKNGVDIHESFPPYFFVWNKETQSEIAKLGTGYTITVSRTSLAYVGAVILDFLVGEPFILNLPTDGMLIMPDNKYLTLTIGKEYL